MPWTAESFGKKHNHSLTAEQSGHAARIANAVLAKTGDDAKAIRIANAYFRQHLDLGGVAGADVATQPGVMAQPAVSPFVQSQIGALGSLSAEQLQEMALRLRGTPQGQIAQRLLAQKRLLSAQQPGSGTAASPPGAASAGYAEGGALHGPPRTYAVGGGLQARGGAYMPERAPAESGFLSTAGPGRGDNIEINPPVNSYVLPADVVAGLGQGNSLAGAKALEAALAVGPHGIPMPRASGRHTMPSPPPPYHAPDPGFPYHGNGGDYGTGFGNLYARGGEPKRSQVLVAGGEFVVSPAQVAALGGGDVDRGHRVLDSFVKHVRTRTISQMKKLKGPVKA